MTVVCAGAFTVVTVGCSGVVPYCGGFGAGLEVVALACVGAWDGCQAVAELAWLAAAYGLMLGACGVGDCVVGTWPTRGSSGEVPFIGTA